MIVAQVSDKATIPPSDSNREEVVPPHTHLRCCLSVGKLIGFCIVTGILQKTTTANCTENKPNLSDCVVPLE